MKLAPPPLDIGPDKGFENTDLFGYKDFGERFARIVEALSSAVIVLDGPWGSGKTTFTQQWAGLLRKRGHAVVQFDAFANDYHDDAFVALAGAIHACSKDEKLEGLQKLKALFLKSAAGVTKALPPIATRVGINLVTLGALSSAEVSKLVEAIQSANSSQLEKRIAKAYENTQAINEFRDRLTELARELARSRTSGTEETDPANKTQQQKLVFIIDELDRCKPTFALNLLERIKHLFSVDEIVFVLVAHLPQLARMVEKEYGVSSGVQYLEKFHHWRVSLPNKTSAAHEGKQARYLDHLLREMDVPARVLDDLLRGLLALADIHGLPLRTLEQVVNNVALVFLGTDDRYIAPLIYGLAVMRIVDPELYEKARTGRLNMDDALRFLRFDEWNTERIHAETVKRHKDTWTYATVRDDELDQNTRAALDLRIVPMTGLTGPQLMTMTCEQIDGLWQHDLQ